MCTGFVADGRGPARGPLQISLRSARLLERQAQLRLAVESEQEEINQLSDRMYQRFVRTCIKQRIDMIKQVGAVSDRGGGFGEMAGIVDKDAGACLHELSTRKSTPPRAWQLKPTHYQKPLRVTILDWIT